MDGILKNYFDTFRERNELPPEIKGKIKDAKLFDDMKDLKVWRDINFGKGGLSASFPEYDIFLRGAIDEILINKKGEFIPFDFKTRGYALKEDTHKHYQSQLDLYALLFEKNSLKSAQIGYLLFFWPKDYRKEKAEFNTELIKMNISAKNGLKILDKVHKIVSGKKPKAHVDCEYCLYRGSVS